MFTKEEIRANMRRTARNGKHYAVGDVVLFRFDHDLTWGKPREVAGRIIEINPRYTSRDSITYVFTAGMLSEVELQGGGNIHEKHRYADAGFIVDVLGHREDVASPLKRFVAPPEWLKKTRSQYIGWPTAMLWDVLDGKYLDLPLPLDTGRFWQAFQKHKPGVVEEVHNGLYRVNRKPFERWVMRNYRRFMATTADCIEDAIDEYKREAADRGWVDREDIDAADALDQSHRWFGGEGSPHMDELGTDEREEALFNEEIAG